jgi:hypothetical protein
MRWKKCHSISLKKRSGEGETVDAEAVTAALPNLRDRTTHKMYLIWMKYLFLFSNMSAFLMLAILNYSWISLASKQLAILKKKKRKRGWVREAPSTDYRSVQETRRF